MAREEGIFSEPAGVTAVAGLVQAVRNGEVAPDARICCPITGSAFKDPNALEAMTRDTECPLLDFAEWDQRVSKA